ncbi:MAG: isochorismatase [Bacillus thermozeamaize]|jgi:nicotinamidase-related amidase|uniref:Isochorismatase n=1 Tax=Bacillus thermozeamaize TaxID=230954 RepID=A0A1Y3PNB1_9BACI|nr:MAG: isochorismatase [Bacillus thermozeamaize]
MKKALLVIDVQNEYFTGKLPVSHSDKSLNNILLAMDRAHEKGIPVVVIQHTSRAQNAATFRKGSPEWELHPEIAKRPCDLLIEKHLPGSFTGTRLEDWLKSKGIAGVAISGYMTHMCCDTTARQAFHLGFAVDFLADATGTISIKNEAGEVTAEELHQTILVAQGSLFSKVLKTSDWIETL